MLKNVPVANITALPNYRTIDTDNGEFADLVQSVKDDGVLQSVLLRPNPGKPGHYQLIFGNRRFAAAKLALIPNIPASIKEVSDDDVIVYQTKENLQRKDVHPMDEAAAFKAYQAVKKCDVKELAAVFAKQERYVTHRLALNNLTADLQKEFLKGILSVAQAELFAKLPDLQQKELKKQCYNTWQKKYSSPVDLKETIEKLFLSKLSSAPWKLDDAALVPAAGSCKDCKKRSSCQGLLFEGLVKDDRCLDTVCFKNKAAAHFMAEVEKIATTKPEIIFLHSGNDLPKEVKKIADDNNITVIGEYNGGVRSWKSAGFKEVKCFVVAGYDKGKYKTMYLEPKGKAAAKVVKGGTGAAAIKEQAAAIQQRVERSKELDHEKVQEIIVKQLRAIAPDDKLVIVQHEEDLLKSLMAFVLYDACGYTDDDFNNQLGIMEDINFDHDEDPVYFKERLAKLNHVQLTNLLKKAMLHRYSGCKQKSAKTYFMRDLAAWFGVDVAGIITQQDVIATKRETNAAKRIEALQATAKPVAAGVKKIAAGVKKIAPGAKKVAKKSKAKTAKKKAA